MLVDQLSGLGARDGILTIGPHQRDAGVAVLILRALYVRTRPETPNLPAIRPQEPARLRMDRTRWLEPGVMLGWSQQTPLRVYRFVTSR